MLILLEFRKLNSRTTFFVLFTVVTAWFLLLKDNPLFFWTLLVLAGRLVCCVVLVLCWLDHTAYFRRLLHKGIQFWVIISSTFHHLCENIVNIGAICSRNFVKCQFVLLCKLQTLLFLDFAVMLKVQLISHEHYDDLVFGSMFIYIPTYKYWFRWTTSPDCQKSGHLWYHTQGALLLRLYSRP